MPILRLIAFPKALAGALNFRMVPALLEYIENSVIPNHSLRFATSRVWNDGDYIHYSYSTVSALIDVRASRYLANNASISPTVAVSPRAAPAKRSPMIFQSSAVKLKSTCWFCSMINATFTISSCALAGQHSAGKDIFQCRHFQLILQAPQEPFHPIRVPKTAGTFGDYAGFFARRMWRLLWTKTAQVGL